ncbi:hypothetical protein VitviT2T_023110 [Vitis vinifera]|uniref:Uncharacterized protein n=1 Tax=Vitis vinifera TaxID=29760 RepID=A0ABY9DEB9_VITVI|nr:hypothetical protein VitviT2T_023110 [Vitis vinifera]
MDLQGVRKAYQVLAQLKKPHLFTQKLSVIPSPKPYVSVDLRVQGRRFFSFGIEDWKNLVFCYYNLINSAVKYLKKLKDELATGLH